MLLLDAATAVFGELGYHGASTHAIARAAGVSQPYVVRMFGGKEALFLAVLERSVERMIDAFAEARAAHLANPEGDTLTRIVGERYVDLLSDRGLLRSMMHAFMLGSDPVIGPAARAGILRVHAYLREELGIDAADAHHFLATGMLMNTVVALRLADDFDREPAVRELLGEMLPTKLPTLLALARDDR